MSNLTPTERGAYIIKRRKELANAVQSARREWKGSAGGVSMDRYKEFWSYFLPDDFLEDPQGYLLFGG